MKCSADGELPRERKVYLAVYVSHPAVELYKEYLLINFSRDFKEVFIMLNNSKSNSPLLRLCVNAVMVALFLVFDLISIKFGNFKITFGGLPIILTAVMFGPLDGAVVGLLGSFLGQIFTYGIGITTPLWILPAGIRGLVMGLLFIAFKRSKNFGILTLEIVISSLIVTLANTGVIYLDSIILDYPSGIVLIQTALRAVSGILSAIVYSVIIKALMIVVDRYSTSHTKA